MLFFLRFVFLHFRIINWGFPLFDGLFYVIYLSLPLSVVSWRFSFLHFRIINWVFPRFDGGLFFFNISVLNRCLSYCLLSFACFFRHFRIINWGFPRLDGLFYVICLSLPLIAHFCVFFNVFFVRFVSCLSFFAFSAVVFFLLFFSVCLKQN